MLICLEGPDKAGKTTLFNELCERLVDFEHAPTLDVARELYPHFSHVEELIERLWSALYDPSKDYLVDRSFTVTPQVYSRLHARELRVDWTKWAHHQLVFALLPPAEVLARRDREDHSLTRTMYAGAVEEYRRVLVDYDWVEVPWDMPVHCQADFVVSRLDAGSSRLSGAV